ncbi:hypothetical protein ABZW30_38915 [Kitasatospora sp. NPDC004669]|uniref:hypothetical protein n=1 Tax=Kitasatospora sp. NPDC004669 TaxID=3154555 RepID=UPI0033ADE6C6
MTLAPEQEDRPAPGRSFPVADAWAPAFGAVPRSLFLPDLIWAHDMATGKSRPLERTEDEQGWPAAAASDIPIVTQWDDGEHQGAEPGTVPTSSLTCTLYVRRFASTRLWRALQSSVGRPPTPRRPTASATGAARRSSLSSRCRT